MTRDRGHLGWIVGLVLLAVALLAPPVSAEDIEVSNYGNATNGMPYAVAMAKGFFKEAGADVTGIRSSPGGGTTIRNLLAGDLPYGEAALGAAVTAIQEGADIKIISGNVHTVAEVVWVTMLNSPVKSLNDLKGRRLGFTNPRSTTQAMDFLLLEKIGLSQDDVKLIRTGSFGAGLTALEAGGVDVMPIPDPMFSNSPGKYRAVAWAGEVLPALSNVVGVTTGKVARTKPEFIRAVLVARRRAVEFMYARPREAAEIIAKAYNLDVGVTERVIRNLIEKGSVGELPYWGPGSFHLEGMNNMIRAQKLVGALKGDVDWSKMIDESFLPEDLRSRKK